MSDGRLQVAGPALPPRPPRRRTQRPAYASFDPVPQILSSCGLGEGVTRWMRPAPPRIPQRGGPHRFRGYGLESWPRRNPRTSSRRLDAPGAAPGRASLTTAGRGRRSGFVAIAVGVALAAFLPDQLQRQVLVRLQFLVDLGPVWFGMLAPNAGGWPLRKQRSLDLLVVPVLRRRPLHAGRLRGRQVLMDGALRDGATAGDLVLAQSEGMEPQNFPSTCASSASSVATRESPLTSGSLIATAALRAIPLQCRSAFRTSSRKTDRLQFGTLIGITSES